MKTRDIVIICLTIIILLIAGIFISSVLNSAEDTTLKITTNSTLNEGEHIGFKLTSENGSAISGQVIEINFDYNKAMILFFGIHISFLLSRKKHILLVLEVYDYQMIRWDKAKRKRASGVRSGMVDFI